ncbi:MAG: GNAT family N-acetyltransferase [Lachnospiraceae bacterium]|nr:GNAT family N-acetyltransferase [Lachnospiraceae bacterium]
MLKKVVFIWEKEEIIEDMAALLRELEEKQVEVCVVSAECWEHTMIDKGNEVQTDERDSPEETTEKETLYITDNASWQKRLYEEKLPVIIYLHEENREENFMLAEYAIERIKEIELESLELAYLRLTGQPWTILTTNRCIIRETTTDDVDSFYEIYREPSITEYMEGLFADRNEEIAYIQDYIKNVYRFYGYGMWTVLEKTDGKVIGRAGLSWREGYDIPELGFVIGVPWQRQGYAYEVCRAILDYGKEELGFTSFQALVMVENEKSRTLCEKLGFAYEETVEVDGVEYMRMILRE